MNIVSKLRATCIFSAIYGRVGMENPVSLPEENSYVIFTREEQDGATVFHVKRYLFNLEKCSH